jgi:tripartite-type tricarboxylate transporter receptor subunit TctC
MSAGALRLESVSGQVVHQRSFGLHKILLRAFLAIAPCLLGLLSLLSLPSALALTTDSDYPKEALRLLVGSVPGASTDAYARIVGERLGKVLGQNIVIDNRSGASGIIATTALVAAPADGYTLQLIYTPHTLSPTLFKSLNYNPIKDVTGVTMLIKSPLVLAVNAQEGVKSYAELIKLSEQRLMNYGSAGIGSGGHLSAELLRISTGMRLAHIPYRGAAPAAAALLSGDVDFAFIAQITAKELAQAGKLRILGITSKTRSASMPQSPTMQELGVKDFEFQNWFGVIVSAKTPALIVKKLNAALLQVLAMPDIRQRLTQDGSEIVGNSAEEFTAFLNADALKWRSLAGSMELKGD